MVRTYGVLSVALLLTWAGAPMAMAAQGCTGSDDAVLVTQNDAGSGTDAPGTREESLVLPEQDTIIGALQLPGGTVDPSDWYGLRVAPHHENVMVELDPYLEVGHVDWGGLFVVDVVPPQGEPLTIPMGHERVTLAASQGLWHFQVRYVETLDESCPDTVGLVKMDAFIADYYLYVGCDPVCLEGS